MTQRMASDVTTIYIQAANFWEQRAVSLALEMGALRARLAELEPEPEQPDEIPVVNTEETD